LGAVEDRHQSVRGVFAEWNTFELLFGVCDDAVCTVLNTPPWETVAG
jgi:hypothetical protein